MKIKNIQNKIQQDIAFTCGKKKLPHIFSKDELKKYLAYVEDIRIVVIIFLGVFLGLRIGEMIKLTWSDIDLDRKLLKIVDGKNTKRYKSGYGKDRIIPILDPFIRILQYWKAMNPKEIYVIPHQNSDGREKSQNKTRFLSIVRTFQKNMNKDLEQLGLLEVDYYQKDGKPRYTLHSHSLRHTCGCNLRKKGMKIEDIRDYLGHEDIKSTQVYAELTKEDLRENVYLAYNYPKQRNFNPPIEQPSIQFSPDKESLRLLNDNLRMMLELKKSNGGIVNEYMPQQKI